MVNEVSDGAPIGHGLGRGSEDDRPTEIRVRGHVDENPDEWTQSLRAIEVPPEVQPNPWAWIDTDSDETQLVDIGRHHVTAVLVTLDAERWLPETLAGLAALEHRPARIIAIDNESADATRRLLRRALEQEIIDALYDGERGFGFGQAVASALRQDRSHPTSGVPVVSAGPRELPDELDDPYDPEQLYDTEQLYDPEHLYEPGQGIEPSGSEDVPGRTAPDEAEPDEPEPGEPEPDARDLEERDLEERDSEEQGTEPEDPGGAVAAPNHWLWLLHDDAVPAPDALIRLLAQVSAEPSIDVTGPKLLLPRRRRAGQPIAEIGVSISGTGRRELLIDPGEIDQGQRDVPQERLGVSTCGMLVRTAVWDQLGGLDPALPVFRDGVEFGWRAHAAGHRVVTCPQAQFTHRQVGRAGLRQESVIGKRPGKLDRQLGILVVVGHARPAALPFVWLRLVVSCLIRSVGYLLGKVPSRSLDELEALGSFLAHPGRLHAYRKRVRGQRPVDGSADVIRALRPPWWSSLRVAGETITGAVTERYRSVAGELDAATLDELTGDDFAAVGEEKQVTPWLRPAVVATALSVVASLVAARQLFGTGSLAGPALLPAPDLGQLWDSATSAIPGAPEQISPPWLALTALGSTITAGRPEWFVTIALCLVVPLSILTSYPVVRQVLDDWRLRLWAAVTYALLPVLLGGTNQGRLSISVVAVLLPLLVLAVRAIALRRVRAPEAWRGGWGAGVVLVVLVAYEPVLFVLAVLLGIAGAVALRRTPRKIGRIGIALAVPLVVLAPWWPSIVADWGRLLVGPDSALRGVPAAPEVWQLLIGRDRGAGLPALWIGLVFFGAIWLLALGGLVRRARERMVLASWTTALAALAVAIVVSRLVVDVPPIGLQVRPAVGSLLLIAFAALVLGGAIGLDGLAGQVRAQSFSWLQPATVLLAAAMAAVSLGAATWWVLAGATGPIDRQPLNAIPPYVRNAMLSSAQVRVLAIDLSSRAARYTVLAGEGQRLGSADRGFTFGGSETADEQARDLVLRLVAGTADEDIVPQLRELGIGFVWVRDASEEDKARIDNTPGLGTASGTGDDTIWQVDQGVSRVALATPGSPAIALGPSPTTVPAGTGDRNLLVGEAADPRWRADLDGAALAPAPGGWQQAFTVPAAAGTLRFQLSTPAGWLLIVQGIVWLVVIVLAAPAVRRPEVRDPTRSARRASNVLGGRR
ncbi:glycosyltransferase [Microlunatus ginsengisoli]|uniref:Glycosyltransferase, GT2 family n=1 Tax=Microlunatus ginsengisoli TaxID=363863 RepID=A0ABP6ZFJ8_9ACTN